MILSQSFVGPAFG